MLSESLIKQSKQLDNLQLEDYKKVINYCINLILNRDNEMKLNQFIQIEQEKGDQITNICIAIVTSLSKFRNSAKEFDKDLGLLFLSKNKKQYLAEKMKSQLYELRKVAHWQDLDNLTHFKGLQWRLEVELASRTYKNTFNPNILLNLKTQQQGLPNQLLFNSDFANLKNLHESLQEAMKFHNSNKFKVARNSSV